MTKSERLMRLVSLLKARRVTTIAEMSQRFSVSQRSIYRDLRALSRMGVPVYHDRGYRYDWNRDFSLGELTADEVELVLFGLRNNPLAGYPFFGKRFSRIERKILKQTKKGWRKGGENLFVQGRPVRGAPDEAASKLLTRFSQAITTSHKVVVRSGINDSGESLFRPAAIRLTPHGPLLVVARGPGDRLVELALTGIASLAISTEPFDPSE